MRILLLALCAILGLCLWGFGTNSMAQERVAPSEFPAPVPVPGLRSSLPDGYRAITISLSRFDSEGGPFRPGDRVDVVRGPLTEARVGEPVEIVFGARVLSFETPEKEGAGESGWPHGQITLLATSGDVARISLAVERGSVIIRRTRNSKPQDGGR